MSADLFPELDDERARLSFTRAARDRMIAQFESLDPTASADEITQEFVEMTVDEAHESLRSPGAGEFFGRIDTPEESGELARWYIGRRHIEDERHDPVVVDWRAPIAAPFYRATAVDPLGVDFRRRFTLADGDLVAYLDEHLDDPDGAATAAGIPDPVLAEIGAERSGEMREIVATIQGEQDVVIRSDIDQVLIVQGGPGTGKTAVALHRAAFLLFEHRARLARDGVLVVGPNKAFLDYIGNVLPSLGERSVRQATADELCIPRIEVTGVDDAETARWKGSADRIDDLAAAALDAIAGPDDDIVVPIGVRKHVITAAEFGAWIATAKSGTGPINERRARLQAIARRELTRRAGDDVWSKAGPLKSAISKAWPTQKPAKLVDRLLPGPSGKKRVWTRADQMLVDEANSLLDGSPFTYGHVVVDEAQDHSAVALRVIGRRSPAGSMTLVGDVAQSTTPAGQERWHDVFAHVGVGSDQGIVADLTIGYRVPEPILTVANRLLPLTEVDATESRSVRTTGDAPRWIRVAADAIGSATVDAVHGAKELHSLVGVVAPPEIHAALTASFADAGLRAADHLHDLATDEIPLFGPVEVKGLEFDGVIVVNPHLILSESSSDAQHTSRGARLLYVAMTRAVQRLTFVTDAPAPAVIAPSRLSERV